MSQPHNGSVLGRTWAPEVRGSQPTAAKQEGGQGLCRDTICPGLGHFTKFFSDIQVLKRI
jgi:hypothetical protein